MVELITGDAVNVVIEKIVKYPLALVVLIASVLICNKVLKLSVYLTIMVSLALAVLSAIFVPMIIV